MAEDTPSRLTAEEAQQKALECRNLSKRATKAEHRIMLGHIAETWERIAAEVKRYDGG